MTTAIAGLLGTSSLSSYTAAYPLYQRLQKAGGADYAKFVATPAIQSNVDYLKKTLPTIKTADDLVKNTKLLGIVLTAFGLQDDAQYPARVAGVLKSDLSNDSSLANALVDPRYKQLAKFFNFNTLQGKNLSLQSFAQDLADKYTQGAYEVSLDQQNPALRSASYFEQKIGSVTSAYDILGDSVLRDVVTKTLGLPANIAVLPIEDQAALLNQKLDLTKFQDASATTASKAAVSAASDDLTRLGKLSTAAGNSLDPVQSIADRAQALLDSYNQLGNITSTSGPYATEVAVQQAAVPVLALQQGLLTAAGQATGTILNLSQGLASAIATAQAGGLSASDLSALQSEFASSVAQANTLTQQASYGGQNLLDGSVTQPISVDITSTGQASTINAYDYNNGVLDNLASANAAFQSGDYAGAAAFLQTAQSSIYTSIQQQGIDSSNFAAGIASIPQWVTTQNEPNLTAATQTIVSAQSAAGDANGLVQQILSLAQQAATSGLPNGDPGLQDLNTQYQDLLTQLQTTLSGASYNGQSLLDGSAVLIGTSATAGRVDLGNAQRLDGTTTPVASAAINGVNLLQYANGGAGGANDLFNLDLTTGAGAQSVVDAINNTINPDLQRAFRVLGTDSAAFGAVAQVDPRAALDAQYRQLASDVADQAAAAVSNGELTSTSAQDQYLSVGTTGAYISLHANASYSSQVADTLVAGSLLLDTDFASALSSLTDATFYANETADSLKADKRAIDLQTSLVTNFKNATTQTNAPGDFAPFNSTNEAVQAFVAKYLVLQDAQSTTATSGASSWKLSLFA